MAGGKLHDRPRFGLARREGPRADASRVSFHDPEHAIDRSETHSGARERAADHRARGSHEWICPEVDVEHRALGAFEERVSALPMQHAQEFGHVDDERVRFFRLLYDVVS